MMVIQGRDPKTYLLTVISIYKDSFAKCMMIFNMRVSPVRTQMKSTQKINNFETSTQKITNLHVCSLD